MALSNPCSIGNARAAALCLVRIGNEKRRPLSSHVRRLTYHVCGSFMDNKESRFQLFLLVYEPAARGFLARFALLNGLSLASPQLFSRICCNWADSCGITLSNLSSSGDRCLCRSVGETTLISMPRHPIEAARERGEACQQEGIVAYIQPGHRLLDRHRPAARHTL